MVPIPDRSAQGRPPGLDMGSLIGHDPPLAEETMNESELFPSDWTAFCSRFGGFPRWVDFKKLEGGYTILEVLNENRGWPTSVRHLVLGQLLEKGRPHEWILAAVDDPDCAYPYLVSSILERGSSRDWFDLFCKTIFMRSVSTNPDFGRFVEHFATRGLVEDLLAFVYVCRRYRFRLADEEHTKLRNRAAQLGGERGLARYDFTREGIYWPFTAREGAVVGKFPEALEGWRGILTRLQKTGLEERLGHLGFAPASGIAGILAALDRTMGLLDDTDRASALGVSRRTVCAWSRGVQDPDNQALLRMGQLLGLQIPTLTELLGAIQHRHGWHSWNPLAKALAVSPRTIESWARERAQPPSKLIPVLLFLAESNWRSRDWVRTLT